MRDLEAVQQYEYIEKARAYVKRREDELGRKLTYNVKTFGCQMNARDSEKLEGILEEIGYVESDDEHADFVVYNTCTVRENANNKVYGRLGYLQKYKKQMKNASICPYIFAHPHTLTHIFIYNQLIVSVINILYLSKRK